MILQRPYPSNTQVHTLLRLTTLLHKRILLDILPLSCPTIQNPSLDALLIHSSSLHTSTDDLISTLYTPQNPTSIHTELITLVDVIRAIQSGLTAVFLGLEDHLATLSIQDQASGNENSKGNKTIKDIKKWFDTCFEQIYKLSTTFMSTLTQDEHNISLNVL